MKNHKRNDTDSQRGNDKQLKILKNNGNGNGISDDYGGKDGDHENDDKGKDGGR